MTPFRQGVACPFWLIMLEEVATSRGAQERLALKDIAELVAGAL
jgi:hypothetical protein